MLFGSLALGTITTRSEAFFNWRNEIGSPQTEHGYIRIATELFEALMETRIAGEERQILDTIIRKTYGWNKKSDWISRSTFSEVTGIKESNVQRALKKLEYRKIICVNKESPLRPKYSFNKHYGEWREGLKKERDSILSKEGLNTESPRDSIRNPTIDTTKDTIQKTDINRVFDYWNKSEIMKHRNIGKFFSHINAALLNYEANEIEDAIRNYKEVLENKKYFWTYRWGLGDFLARKNGIDKFMTENKPFENFLAEKGGSNGRSGQEVRGAQRKSEEKAGTSEKRKTDYGKKTIVYAGYKKTEV